MQTSLIICLIVFLVLLVVLERLRSIRIIIRIALSIAIMYGYIQAIIAGKSIIKFSILIAVSLCVVNVLVKNGIHRKSFSEIVSILAVSGITSVAVYLICKGKDLKLFQDEIMIFNGFRKPENIMFSIFLITTLGVYMDIVSKIISQLDEQKDKTTDTPWKEQYLKGIDIGSKCISERINTMFLILGGIVIIPICIKMNKGIGFSDLFSEADVFAYLLVAIVANIGFAISGPITAFVYACLNRKKTIYKTVSENKLDGKRSLKL